MLEFEPSLVCRDISSRNFPFDIQGKRREHMINVPTVESAKQIVVCRICFGKKAGKSGKFSFTFVAASCVHALPIGEYHANPECEIDGAKVYKCNAWRLTWHG